MYKHGRSYSKSVLHISGFNLNSPNWGLNNTHWEKYSPKNVYHFEGKTYSELGLVYWCVVLNFISEISFIAFSYFLSNNVCLQNEKLYPFGSTVRTTVCRLQHKTNEPEMNQYYSRNNSKQWQKKNQETSARKTNIYSGQWRSHQDEESRKNVLCDCLNCENIDTFTFASSEKRRKCVASCIIFVKKASKRKLSTAVVDSSEMNPFWWITPMYYWLNRKQLLVLLNFCEKCLWGFAIWQWIMT